MFNENIIVHGNQCLLFIWFIEKSSVNQFDAKYNV